MRFGSAGNLTVHYETSTRTTRFAQKLLVTDNTLSPSPSPSSPSCSYSKTEYFSHSFTSYISRPLLSSVHNANITTTFCFSSVIHPTAANLGISLEQRVRCPCRGEIVQFRISRCPSIRCLDSGNTPLREEDHVYDRPLQALEEAQGRAKGRRLSGWVVQ